MVTNAPVSAGDVRDISSIPGSGILPRGGHSIPLQYSCLGNPIDRQAWGATVQRSKSIRHDRSDVAHTHASSFHPWIRQKLIICSNERFQERNLN